MLTNYYKDELGVIHQINVNQEVKYDKQYIDERYHQYIEKCINMSHLRLGYIVGGIQRTPESILDVGYGSGDFLKVCKKFIPKCYGNDVTGLSLPEGVEFVENIFENFYDVICFFDVLEHFSDINVVKNLKCNFVCISVPWCHYFSDEWFQTWKHRRPDEHLHHFNLNSLINFFNSCGFEIVCHSNIEDTIRKDIDKNILSCIFKNIK